MRTLGIAIVALAVLSCYAAADEPIAAVHQAVTAPTDDATQVTYPLKWQRRLLAAQLSFAATLQKTDPIQTGSITLQAR